MIAPALNGNTITPTTATARFAATGDAAAKTKLTAAVGRLARIANMIRIPSVRHQYPFTMRALRSVAPLGRLAFDDHGLREERPANGEVDTEGNPDNRHEQRHDDDKHAQRRQQQRAHTRQHPAVYRLEVRGDAVGHARDPQRDGCLRDDPNYDARNRQDRSHDDAGDGVPDETADNRPGGAGRQSHGRDRQKLAEVQPVQPDGAFDDLAHVHGPPQPGRRRVHHSRLTLLKE